MVPACCWRTSRLGNLDQVGYDFGQWSAGVQLVGTTCPDQRLDRRELMEDQFSLGVELAPVVRLPSSDPVEDDIGRCAE